MSQVFKKITPTTILSFLGICILIILMGGLFIDAIKDDANTPSYEEREDARNSQQLITDNYGNQYFQDRISKLAGESDQQFAQRVKEAGQKIKDRGNYIIGVSGSVGEIARVWIKYNSGSPPPGYKEPSISPP